MSMEQKMQEQIEGSLFSEKENYIDLFDDSLSWFNWLEQSTSHGLNEDSLSDAIRSIYTKVNEIIGVINRNTKLKLSSSVNILVDQSEPYETKPIMLEESERIELETVQTIELLSNYETHLKENYQIEIPEEAMVRFLEK